MTVPVCKINHDDPHELTLPKFLCRACNPPDPDAALFVAAAVKPWAPGITTQAEADPDTAKRYRAKKRRRLRAEVRERSEFLEKLRAARAAKTDIDKAERAWQSAYTELAALEDDHG